MEGVMMKSNDAYAVAVRKPNNEIAIEKKEYKSFSDKVKIFKLPIFRGMLVFVESLVIGMKVLNFSASFFEEEEEEKKSKKSKNKKRDRNKEKKLAVEEISISETSTDEEKAPASAENNKKNIKQEEGSNALLMAAAVLLSIAMSIALFMVLPVLISNLFSNYITNHYTLAFVEGLLRLAIFIGYVLAASQMKEIKRVFMYHGAEHKTINCIENGFELTVENVRWQSKQNKRCGTSFMLFVMLISLIFFIFLPSGNLAWRILTRVFLIPIISGVSYEFIRLAGKRDNVVLNILSKPGLIMQGLTTKEPDDSMIEVAIKSVEAVFDWRAFLEDNNSKKEEEPVQNRGTQSLRKSTSVKKEANQSIDMIKENKMKHNINKDDHTAALQEKPRSTSISFELTEEEDDEILKALDKYLD